MADGYNIFCSWLNFLSSTITIFACVINVMYKNILVTFKHWKLTELCHLQFHVKTDFNRFCPQNISVGCNIFWSWLNFLTSTTNIISYVAKRSIFMFLCPFSDLGQSLMSPLGNIEVELWFPWRIGFFVVWTALLS